MQEEYSSSQIELYCSFIDEIVCRAEWVVEKSLIHNKEQSIELAALLSLNQMTDLADGVCILLKQHSNNSAVPVIRTLFEVAINLEYLLQDDYDKKAINFLFYYYKKKEKEFLGLTAGTVENQKLTETLKSDKNVSKETIHNFTSEPGIEENLKAISVTLQADIYKEVSENYNNSNAANKKYWYSLMGGPLNFQALVKKVGMQSRYEVSYVNWSAQVHGWDIVNRNLVFEEGYARLIAKRNSSGTYDNASEAITILRRSLMKYVQTRLQRV